MNKSVLTGRIRIACRWQKKVPSIHESIFLEGR
jgi:hypothetical protein